MIQRECTNKKTGKCSSEIAYGINNKTIEQANPRKVIETNRGHWCIANSCHYIIDWNYDEDRSRIRSGHDPENVTRLRRFATGLIKCKGVRSVSRKIQQLNHNIRWVFDYPCVKLKNSGLAILEQIHHRAIACRFGTKNAFKFELNCVA